MKSRKRKKRPFINESIPLTKKRKKTTKKEKLHNTLYHQAAYFLKKSQNQNSLFKINECIRMYPDTYDNTYFLRSCIYYDLERIEKCLDDLEKAIMINPRFIDAYSFRAKIYCEEGIIGKAVDEYNIILRILSEENEKMMSCKYYYKRGKCLYKLNRFKESIIDFNTSIDLYVYNEGFNIGKSYLWRSKACRKIGNYSQFLSDLRTSNELLDYDRVKDIEQTICGNTKLNFDVIIEI